MGDRKENRHIRTAPFIIWNPDRVTDHPDFQDSKSYCRVLTCMPTLVQIGPAFAKKKAIKIEWTDARTDTQSVFIV